VRRFLDGLYGLCGFIAALNIIAILGTVAFQVLARFIAVTFDATEISGFCLAAAIFFGLAYTFRAGAHIRMTMLIQNASATRKRQIELYCTAVAAVSAGYMTFYAADMTIDSYTFGDKSPGLMAVPFWIPQVAMVIGLGVFTIALVDEFVAVLRHQKAPEFKDVEQIEIDDALKEIGVTPAGAAPPAAQPARG
jgi:TRAP-type C4-dicarboxylate transport system permease small subunit